MSLAIDIGHVAAVLIDGAWHDVADKSFEMDAYEFVYAPERSENEELVHGGGHSGVCATGFSFKTPDGDWISGPLTAVSAVRHTQQ